MYKGGWKENKRYGKGILETDGGKIFKGLFIDGELNGIVEVKLSDGNWIKEEFYKGRFVKKLWFYFQ